MKGCSANNLVSKPSFSAFAKASSVVPILEHSFWKILKLGCSLKFLQISWSDEIAIKLAPKIVSGLVVNTLNLPHIKTGHAVYPDTHKYLAGIFWEGSCFGFMGW